MQLYPLKIFSNKTNFDFISLKNINYFISISLIILSILSVLKYKFNYGIDFAGGISIEVRTDQTPDLAQMREKLNELNIGEVVLQNFGNHNDLSIKVANHGNLDINQNVNLVKKALADNFPYNFEYRKIDYVGPQVGSQLIKSGILAMVLAFLAIMCYVWFRFEWYFGIGVLLALIHDCIIALGFMSITGLDFNLSSIAALLTIIGYSVNDSVVIYDRIRENIRKFSKKPIYEIINLSINETLSRTTLTVLTTLLANLALIFFGGETIRSFSILVFVGIIVGTYSSIFISAPVLTLFNKSFSATKKNIPVNQISTANYNK